MAITISLTNTSTEDQSVTLFDNGGANSNNFTTLNQSSVAQSQFISAVSGSPSTQQVFQAVNFITIRFLTLRGIIMVVYLPH